jgi:hypothetical protein
MEGSLWLGVLVMTNLKKKMISDYPHLLKEYNGNGDATKIVAGTNKKLNWKCSTCEHEWPASGNNRVSKEMDVHLCVIQDIYILMVEILWPTPIQS